LRERFYIENNECVNKRVPGRTPQDSRANWYANNREAKIKRVTAYNQANREAINAKMRELRAKKKASKLATNVSF
jgi:hypothetical protein